MVILILKSLKLGDFAHLCVIATQFNDSLGYEIYFKLMQYFAPLEFKLKLSFFHSGRKNIRYILFYLSSINSNNDQTLIKYFSSC